MKRSAIFLILGVAAISCGSVGKPSIQHAWDKEASFAGIKTFAWYDGPPFQYPHGGGMVDGRFIDLHVREAVEKELTRKGYTKVSGASPDIYVTYATSPEGILQQDKWGSYQYWSGTIYLSSKWEKEGTLALDIRKSDMKLVWRGVYTGMIGTNPEQLADKIENATEKLLAKFPPPPGNP